MLKYISAELPTETQNLPDVDQQAIQQITNTFHKVKLISILIVLDFWT